MNLTMTDASKCCFTDFVKNPMFIARQANSGRMTL
jgi:hypothetical protein